MNTRAALAHVASDALGSVSAIAAAVLVLAFGWNRADSLASLVISALILWGAFRLVSETVSVLMEGVPSGVALDDLEETIRTTPGVADLHDLHAWTISDGFDSVTVHVVLDGTAHGTDVAREVGERIRVQHKVSHVTVQPEAPPLSPALHPAQNLLRKRKV
jgi:cobalt-zinc-cadmium efflux system protein